MSWTCQRQSAGKVCKTKNTGRARKCVKCGKPKPPKRRPEHMKALDLTYEEYIEFNGGEVCGICGRKPSKNRRLDRDHDHVTGQPRGLLCARCNRALPGHINTAWLAAAIQYLERAEATVTNS